MQESDILTLAVVKSGYDKLGVYLLNLLHCEDISPQNECNTLQL